MLNLAAQAELLMILGVKANSRHGFKTGLENYCQAIWGDQGLQQARMYNPDVELFKSDRQRFFDELHNYMKKKLHTEKF